MLRKGLSRFFALSMASIAVFTMTVFAAPSTEAIKGTPKIDGEMDAAWKNAKVIDVNVKQAEWVENGATAKVRTMWDENYFYVFAEVTDPTPSKDPDQQPWHTDGFEIMLDEGNEKDTAYDGNDSHTRVDIENVVTAGANGDVDNTVSAVKKTSKGYIVEAAIPWRGAVKEGQTIGADFQVNDDPNVGARKSIAGWSQTNSDAWANPSVMGNIKLVAAPAAAETATETKTETKKAANPRTGDAGTMAYVAVAGLSALALAAGKKKK